MVKRRKFMIGMGSLAAGSAAAMGTGAFDSGKTDVNSSLNIVNDANALIALGNAEGQQVYVEDGQLKMDFSGGKSGAGAGVQPGSVYNYKPAFTITNNDGQAHDITLSYNLNDYSGGSPAWANIQFTVEDGEGNTYGFGAKEQNSGNANTVTVPDVSSGEVLTVDIRVDVKEKASTTDNLDGELVIQANEA
jgi:hypothetical protein